MLALICIKDFIWWRYKNTAGRDRDFSHKMHTFLFLNAEPSAPPGPCFLFEAASAISIDTLEPNIAE